MSLPDRYPYQEFMYQKGVKRKKTAIIGKPGCGKTRPIIDILVDLQIIVPFSASEGDVTFFPNGSVFIMCSGPAIATWIRQLPKWADAPELIEHIHVITGDIYKRADMRRVAWFNARNNLGIYITNFTCFRLDFALIRQIQWGAVVADEYHKVMRRRQSSTFKRFRSWTRHQEVMILATGSAWSKEPGSMWTAFTLIEPELKLFRSYWRYLETFCIIEEGAYGREILGLKNVESFKSLTDKYFAYVPAEVIADQQPDGLRVAIDVQMDKEQVNIYSQIAKDMVAFLDGGGMVVAPTIMGKILLLRQLLCCPKILDESLGMGAGYETILDRLEEQSHVVIFVPFRPAVGYIVDALHKKGYHADGLLGGIGYVEQARIIERFRQERGIIVCTIAYAESFDLETCDTSYFLGYDFNLDPNQQAEGRTQRAISEHAFVTWNYLRHVGTYDEVMLMNLNEDMLNQNKVLKRPKAFINALKGIQDV